MTSILTDCANNIVGRVINLIVEESRNVCCFKCIVDDFEKEKPELEAKWRTISKDIEDAKRRAEDIRDDVIHWEVEAKKFIDEDTKTKVPCFGGWCPNCIWRYQRGKELTEMTNDVRRLKGTNFHSVGRSPHLPGVETHSSQGFIHFESRDSEYKQLLDAIADENNYITGLQGMGGVGKTTLATEVGRKLEESGKFDCVAFATVSNNPDIKKIQDSIAGPIGLSLKDKNEWERGNTIRKRLTDGQKFLIILDDVWEHIRFEEIGIPSGDSHKNCRVLLTSRDVRVCNSMGCSRLIQMGLLSDQDAWILFKKHAGIDDSFPKKLKDKGQKITKECKNLPVAIAAIASSLKNRPLEEWDAALTALQNPMPMLDVDDNLTKIYKVLRYSYDNMKSDKAKRLFLLLSLFPVDFEISTEMLTRIGIAAGLFGEVDRYCEGRNQLLALRTKLIHSCLWLETEDRGVKLHDLVREVALWIANGDIQSIQLSRKNRKALGEKEMKVKYLFCNDLEVRDMDVFPRRFDASELEILLIYMEVSGYVKVSDAFLEKMTRLRVLFLVHNFGSKLSLTLPVSLQSLSNIRSLTLIDWELGDISIFGTLAILEILHLLGCSISELPNEIAKLEKLRLLQLDECEIERNNPFEVIERCSQLEELYFSGNEFSVDDTVNEVAAIHQNTTLPILNRYHLEKDDEMDDLISKIICLPNIDALVSEATFKALVQGAEILQLSEIVGEWRNLIPEIVPMEDNGMNDLIELSLKSCSKVKCLMNTMHSDCGVPNAFSKLVELNLEDMDNLEDLFVGPLPLEFLKSLERLYFKKCEKLQGMFFKWKFNLCNLKIMEVDDCPMLTSLFQPSTARSLVLLEELTIRHCKELRNIITGEESKDEEEEERIDGNKGYDIMFPKLRILQIEDCRRLECISPIHTMFPKLKILEVKNCDRLECIFPIFYLRDIPQLETMDIIHCGELKYIFGGWEQEEEEVIVGSSQERDPSQESYPPTSSSSSSRNGSKAKQPNSPNSKIFPWSCCYPKKYGSKLRSGTSIKMPMNSIPGQGFQASNSECNRTVSFFRSLSGHSQNLSNIRIMRLWKCSKMASVFTISFTSIMLLEKLRVDECHELKQIITYIRDDEDRKNCSSIFPKLKEISIQNCNQFKYLIGPNRHEECNLELHIDLPALEQLMLRFLPNMINICPKNYFITWPTLKKFKSTECPQSSDSNLVVSLYSRQFINTNKDTREIEKHFLTLESVCIRDSEVKSMFHVDELQDGFEIIKRPLSMALKYLELDNLPQLTCICVASKNSLTFQHLQTLLIVGCAKLELLFPISVLRCLPELKRLEIIECKELKQIIEEDAENQKVSPQPCFPKLAAFTVRQCHKLKCFIATNDLPNLQYLIINGASELEELFGFEQRQGDDEIRRVEVKLPKLKIVIFMDLQSLCLGAETLQTTRYRVVYNCPKLSMTSTTSLEELRDEYFHGDLRGVIDPKIHDLSWIDLTKMLNKGTTDYLLEPEIQRGSGSKLPSSQTNEELKEEFVEKVASSEIPAVSPTDSKSEGLDRPSPSPLDVTPYKTHSQELANGQSMGESSLMNHQKSLRETESNIEISQGVDEKETIIGKDRASVKPTITIPLPLHSIEAAVKECFQEGSNLTHKEGEIGAISVDNIIVNQRNEEPKKEFIGRASISEMLVIAASPTDSDMIKGSSPSLSNIPLPNIHSNCTKRGVEEGATSENAKVETLSIHLKLASSQPSPSVNPQSESYPDNEISLSQIEAYINKETEGHPTNIEDLRDDDLISLFQLEEEDSDSQIGTTSISVVSADHPVSKDNLVVNVLADMEESLKMPLKDIASSEANSLRLLTALNFLSRLSSKHVTLSKGLKAIIDSLHKEFPSILCSFKQAFATTNKFAVLEEKEKSIKEELAHRKEVATALVSKISKAKYFMDEAQQKEATLKEQMNRLEKEMKDCEADLSSLQEEKTKFVAETMGYKKEFETVRNDRSQMMEDQRNAWQKLSEIDYKWSVLCSQFENNRITASNPS